MKAKHKKLFILSEDNNLKEWVKNKHGSRYKEHHTKYIYILHLLIHAMTFRRTDYDRKGKELNIRKIQTLFGGSSTGVSSILKNLCDWGYIQLFLPFEKGERANSYKLKEQHEDAEISMKFFLTRDVRFLKKIVKEEETRRKTSIEKKVKEVFEKHTALSDECLEYLRKKYWSPEMCLMLDTYKEGNSLKEDDIFKKALSTIKFKKQDHRDLVLFSFLEGDYPVSTGPKTGRLFNPLCNTKREHRDFILLDGKPMLHTDIVNSQIVISIPLIAKALKRKTPADFMRYQNDAINGKFYEVLAECAGIDICDENRRADFKKQFFKEVFFGRIRTPKTEIKEAFKKLYPNVFKAINKIKRADYRKFSRELQSFESDIMINDVLKTLQDEGHLAIPVHDAIYCNNLDTLQRAKELIQERFEVDHGLQIAFKDHSHSAVVPMNTSVAV